MRIVAVEPNRDRESGRDFFVKRKLVSVVDGEHSMKDAPDLPRRFGEGTHCRKIVMHAAGLSASDLGSMLSGLGRFLLVGKAQLFSRFSQDSIIQNAEISRACANIAK